MNPHSKISVLVLDDDPYRHAEFVKNNPNCQVDSVYTCRDAVAKVYDNYYDVICFDHDLGIAANGDYETSIPFAQFVRQMIDEKAILSDVQILVHSANPVGAQNILSYFTRTLNNTFKIPWAWTIPGLFSMMQPDNSQANKN